MKKPYFNLEQRSLIRSETYVGASLELNLAIRILERDIKKEHGFVGLLLYRIMMNKALKKNKLNYK